MKKQNKKAPSKTTTTTAESRRRPGRPSKRDSIDAGLVARMAAAGLTDQQMADVLGISRETLHKHKQHPPLSEVIAAGKKISDARVVRALFERACGYEHEDEEIKVVDHDIIRVPTIKHYPPDPTAMIFWLKNRDPENWRDKHEYTGPDGGPLVVIRDASGKE